MSTSRFLLTLIASLTLTSFVSASDKPTLEMRLEKLAETLEAARIAAHIPGMSIAIVKDDEVVWARGFGLANVETQRPADKRTIYAVGSTTKAFTATLVGMLVDEGKMNWDDPVTKHLPYFDLAVRSEDENAECTLRDLLSHRHGFARMGVLIIGGNASREEVLRTAAGAEPWDDFRKGFHYCNVTYLAAGEAAGVAAGSSWDEMMMERIFKPLEMDSSSLSLLEAQKNPRLALGYKWIATLEQLEHEEMVDLNVIGPAGSINSNAVDMAQWVRLQLGQGETHGVRLISTERILETHEPQIEITNDMSYGLGWMLRKHKGRTLIEHGGNIDGFSAQVGLMPEENVGYVLLMNLSASPLQQASLSMVFDALLDEWPEEPPAEHTAVEIEFEDYVGLYVANFAKFRDEEFEILINDDRLVLDVPSQRSFDLKLPDKDGKWTFALTDSIAISFERDDQGTVVGLTMHQGGFNFSVPRKGLDIESEFPTLELKKYVGIYVRARGGKQVKISIEQGHLTMDDKGNLLSSNTPDAEGHASLRARPDWGATFKTDAEGKIEAFVFHGGAGDRLFTRLADAPDSELPTLEEVLALRKTDMRIAAIMADNGTRITGKVWFAQAGLRGTLTIYTKGSDRYASHLDFGKFGRVSTVARGDKAWINYGLRGLTELNGDELTQALLEHPGAVEGDWNDFFDSVEVIRNDTVNDRPVHVVRLKKGNLPSRTYWVDAEYGDVLLVKQITIDGSVRIPTSVAYADFEELDGLRVPMRIEVKNPASGRKVLTIDKIESGLDLSDEVFTIEDPEANR